jgi:hypothetical protein
MLLLPHMKIALTNIVVILVATMALSMPAICQTPEAEVEVSPPNEKGYQRAEIAIANTDALVHTTKNKAFIIAHLGAGETRIVNRKRLACVKDLFGSGFDPAKVILAEGRPVSGNGRIEIFLGSELMHVALFARNANICTAAWARRRYQTGRVRY